MGRQAIRAVAFGLIILYPLFGYADRSSILGPTGRDNRPEKKRVDKRPRASDELLSQLFLIQAAVREAFIQAENLKIVLGTEEKGQRTQSSIIETGILLRQKVSEIQSQTDKLIAAQLKYKMILNQDPDFRSYLEALSDLNRFASSWEEWSSSPEYWKNIDVANRDLIELKRNLNNALRQNEIFIYRLLAFI